MTKIKNNKMQTKKHLTEMTRREEVGKRIQTAATTDTETLFTELDTTSKGISDAHVQDYREKFGSNQVTRGKKATLFERIVEAFVNPFTAILTGLSIVMLFTDVLFELWFVETVYDTLGNVIEAADPDPFGVIIIMTMVISSGLLRFIQESRSGRAAENLLNMIKTTTSVQRLESGTKEIPLDEVVVGDIVNLAAGDMIPADMRIIQAKDLFISQSALTGESEAVEKTAHIVTDETSAITELSNIAFMGTNVISGSAIGVVVATGDDTLFGEMAKTVSDKPVKTNFEKGVNSVSWLLIRFMMIMVPITFFILGITTGDWTDAVLFGLAVAVGLTPEMLPMIVTACLAKGAVAMSKKKTIIKNLNSIQNIGAVDILCTDKTGTLTQDNVVLMYHLDIHGQENSRVLRHAFLNSYHQTGLRNLMDKAIIKATHDEEDKFDDLRGLSDKFTKVDEIPFDFERRRMSVVVESNTGERKTQMITKGAVEEMLSVSSFAEYGGEVVPLTDDVRKYILKRVDELNEDGMRVIAVAQKSNPSPVGTFSVSDEKDMVLMGFLAFLDPPKESVAAAIKALNEYGVSLKILTGDNDKVTRCICRHVGLPVDRIILGHEVEGMSDAELREVAETVSVFAKLSPQQKARIITALRDNGHTVGFMGDGINDAAGMKASDVGISVDNAVDIAKESADVILLEKDLMVLEQGIIEGRKTYANMIKYIKMTASSNFGNMFAVVAACFLVPFVPMLPIQILLLNLIYDLSCMAIPWDNVDNEYLAIPRKWDAQSIGKFMLWIGPTSSVFDITCYLIMFFILCPAVLITAGYGMFIGDNGLLIPWSELRAMAEAGVPHAREAMILFAAIFQSGWFVLSMWTQTLVIHMIRTPKVPFVKSRASWSVTLFTFSGIALLTAIPFTTFGEKIGVAGRTIDGAFISLPAEFWPWLLANVLGYMILVTIFKKIYIKRYGELL